MATTDPRRPAGAPPTPAPSGGPPPHADSVLESLGKAITDPMREAAGEADDATKDARHKARPEGMRPPGTIGR